ncbi:MAG: OmpA family protein [Rhodospirillaceae bacterium]
MRRGTPVAAIVAVLLLAAPSRAAAGYRAFVYPDRANPDLVVAVDDFRINETVWDYGGVQYVWLNGPAGHFQLPFKRIRQIEFLRLVGRDYSRADWTWFEVKVTGVNPDEAYTGRLEIRVLRGVAAGIPWYLFPSTEADRGRALYRIVFGDAPVPATIPWEAPAAAPKPPPLEVVVPEPARPPVPPAPPVPSEEELFARTSLDDLNREHPLEDVYFDFDKSNLRPDGEEALRRNAAWLHKWPSVKVRVDGCADPRGTNEYNFGLGMRRADTVRAFLVSLGIALDRIEVVAVGETHLVCTDQTEECWARNRRGHFLITAK